MIGSQAAQYIGTYGASSMIFYFSIFSVLQIFFFYLIESWRLEKKNFSSYNE